jgi:hypothetical protein
MKTCDGCVAGDALETGRESPSQRARSLAEQLVQANNALITAVAPCSAREWAQCCREQLPCADPAWSIGITVQHVAASEATVATWIRHLAVGQALPLTMDRLCPGHPVAACCPREETLALLADRASFAAQVVRGLSEAHLEYRASVVFAGGHPWRIEQLIAHLLIGHIEGHVSRIEATLWA